MNISPMKSARLSTDQSIARMQAPKTIEIRPPTNAIHQVRATSSASLRVELPTSGERVQVHARTTSLTLDEGCEDRRRRPSHRLPRTLVAPAPARVFHTDNAQITKTSSAMMAIAQTG